MKCRLILAFGAVAIAAAAAGPSRAEETDAPTSASSPVQEQPLAQKPEAGQPVPGSDDATSMEQDRMNRPGETVNPAAPVEPVALKESAVLPPPAETPAGAQPADQPQPKPTDEPAPVSSSAPQPAPAPKPASEPRLTTLNIPPAATPESEALHKALAGLPAGATDEERNEHEALSAFYESRGYAPIWLAPHAGLTPKGTSILAEIKRANEWGLEAHDFALPKAEAVADASPEALADAEIKMSLAILKYGRYARGGRIIDPSEQLSSYLDRRPQLLKPKSIIDGIAEAEKPDAFLRSLHPVHPQFERLRQKYLALLEHGKEHSAEAKKLLANMEEWRWMPIDMGEVYVWNNIPEFTQRVVKSGKIVREARIVAGETDKQTPIFTRPLRKITFKPTWIVPDSIKVKELWPSLLKGGGLLREWKLEVRTKEGQLVNWHKIDWSAADIREYDVLQPNGPKSVMGKVKFSFPSQHTVFMHDTLERDKWMFHASKRTYSHGCMRVANPIGLAEILLHEDKGMDAAQVRQAVATGPNNNEFPIEHKIFVHMTYFTALVDDDGKLHTFSDVYGHERRITLALEGKWNQIVKGRNHLAPVELDLSEARPRHYAEDDAGDLPAWRQRDSNSFRNGFFNSLFGSAR